MGEIIVDPTASFLLGGTFEFFLSNLGNWRIKEITAPIKTAKIIENPIETPSIFTKNRSSEIIPGLRFVNVKKNEIRIIIKMK